MALTKLVNGKRVPLSDAEEAAVRAEWETNSQQPRPRRVDFENALSRLTLSEYRALRGAIANSDQIALWYDRARTRGSIDMNDPEVITALDAVVNAGLFTRDRINELFA